MIGNHAGLAVHRVQLMAELEEFFLVAIRVMVAIIDAKDGYTHRHFDPEIAEVVGALHERGELEVQTTLLEPEVRESFRS